MDRSREEIQNSEKKSENSEKKKLRKLVIKIVLLKPKFGKKWVTKSLAIKKIQKTDQKILTQKNWRKKNECEFLDPFVKHRVFQLLFFVEIRRRKKSKFFNKI